MDMVGMSMGEEELKKVNGQSMFASVKVGKLWIWDDSGHSAMVTISNVHQSNGVIHVVDTVLLPK
jgi:uncharacterized surface protein with fasciclin (FAS1) repeats